MLTLWVSLDLPQSDIEAPTCMNDGAYATRGSTAMQKALSMQVTNLVGLCSGGAVASAANRPMPSQLMGLEQTM
eukprot:3785716-Lingulodinium_polyedra.AAC.1